MRFPVLYRVFYALIFEDWWLKFICFALAILMWFYIDGELTGQVDVTVQLTADKLDLPPTLALSPNQQLPKLRVVVRGPRNRLQLVSAERVSLKPKKLDNPHDGHNPVNFLPTDAEAEGNFDILSIAPRDGPEAAVELIEIVTRAKPVIVKCRGEPRPGFLLGKGRSDPEKVNIDGPAQEVDAIQSVSTDEIDISDLDQDVTRDVGIAPFADVTGKLISFHCAQRVHVSIPIQPPQARRVMSFDIKTIAPPGIAMQVEPKSMEVEVVGDLSSPELLPAIRLYVEWPETLDLPKEPGASVGPHPAPLRWVAPPRVQIRAVKGGALPSVSVRGTKP
jgi:hypothetical protein